MARPAHTLGAAVDYGEMVARGLCALRAGRLRNIEQVALSEESDRSAQFTLAMVLLINNAAWAEKTSTASIVALSGRNPLNGSSG